MRLLRLDNKKGDKFSLVEFFGEPPAYAILSHTWGPNDTEVTYKDLVKGTGKRKAGYEKIRACARQSAKAGYDYFWVDTCCIDKTSSAELSEAINSMYHWYRKAGVCFAYLEDAPPGLPVSKWSTEIRWFTRGWTLQELVAPKEVEFFASDWSALGKRSAYAIELSEITNIHLKILERQRRVSNLSVAQRMSWAANRETTRSEDLAYCLLGIFDVNMPLLYGEGSIKAFVRLQEEIMKDSYDQSLFAWCRPGRPSDCWVLRSLLAEFPSDFKDSGSFLPVENLAVGLREPYAMTNNGLRITLQMAHAGGSFHVALLHCVESRLPVALILRNHNDEYGRVSIETLEYQKLKDLIQEQAGVMLPTELHCSSKTIYVRKVHKIGHLGEMLKRSDKTLQHPERGVYGSKDAVLVFRNVNS